MMGQAPSCGRRGDGATLPDSTINLAALPTVPQAAAMKYGMSE
jgi:hypothetical protein